MKDWGRLEWFGRLLDAGAEWWTIKTDPLANWVNKMLDKTPF